MSRYFGVPFATSGDRDVTPDAPQGDGSVSYTEGFGFDYERPNSDPNYKPIPREGFNGLLHDVTEAVGEMQKQGVADWTSSAAPYPINALVRHSDIAWLSKVTNNSQEPGAGNNWLNLNFSDVGQNVAVFDAPGTTEWTVPDVLRSGLRKAHVIVTGAGASGGFRNDLGGGGGGAGGTGIGTIDLSGVNSVTVTVGAGGARRTTDGQSGENGGSSSFGSYISATGGKAGAGYSLQGGPGGSASGGQVNISRGDGFNSSAYATVGGNLGYVGGAGGGSYWGSSARPPGTVAPNDSIAPGAGGPGGSVGSSGAGANGIVIVRW